MTDIGFNKRKPYDANKHCGHPMRRDPEFFRESVAKKQRQLDELKALGETRELTIYEKKRIIRTGRTMGFAMESLKKIEALGPDDRPCVKSKGQNTDHPGVGLCAFHCECKGRDGGHLGYRSNKLKDKALADIMDEIDQANMDVLNLEPDVIMLRAKMRLFLDKKQDFEPETVRSLTLISDQLRKTVETINDKKFRSMITREVFDTIMSRIGEVVAKHVSDPEVLERILLDWQKVTVETSGKRVKQLSGVSENG